MSKEYRHILKQALKGKADKAQLRKELTQSLFDIEQVLKDFFDDQTLKLSDIYPNSPLITNGQ